jgi:hypothetical protein
MITSAILIRAEITYLQQHKMRTLRDSTPEWTPFYRLYSIYTSLAYIGPDNRSLLV